MWSFLIFWVCEWMCAVLSCQRLAYGYFDRAPLFRSLINQVMTTYILRIINFCAFVRACVNHLVVVIHTTIVFYCFLFYLLWTFHCAYLACVQILSSLSIFHFLLHQLCVSLMAICFLFFEFVHLCHNFNYFLSSPRLLARSLFYLFAFAITLVFSLFY